MNLHFCDLCNESIPQVDLDLGRAVRRNERLICAACEGAMTSAHARATTPAPAPATHAPGVHPAVASPAGASVAAVALAFSAVALVAGVGASAYLFWHHEETARALRDEILSVQRAAPEPARTVAAQLGEEVSARESEMARLRSELQGLGMRLQELEQGAQERLALERRLDKQDARLAALDDVTSRVEHQARALEALGTAVAELGARPSQRIETPAEDAGTRRWSAPAPAPAAPAAPAATPVAEATPWMRWVGDLASPDSGTRWQAVQSLGDSHDPLVVPHLLPMLDDADIFVRMAACRHLGDLGNVTAIPALIDTLEDDEASVRESALAALRGLSGQSIPFDPMARDPDRAKRVRAWRDWWEQASKELLGAGKARGKG